MCNDEDKPSLRSQLRKYRLPNRKLRSTLFLQKNPGANKGLSLYPNPATSSAILGGAAPGATVRVLDALGCLVATTTADAVGKVRLAGLAPGLYIVRTGSSGRLIVE